MDFKIFYEWNESSGINLSEMYGFRSDIEEGLKSKNYGSGVSEVVCLVICRVVEFKQRKRFKNSTKELSFDVIIDFLAIQSSTLDKKKQIIKEKFIDETQKVLSRSKLSEFNENEFLADLKEIVERSQW